MSNASATKTISPLFVAYRRRLRASFITLAVVFAPVYFLLAGEDLLIPRIVFVVIWTLAIISTSNKMTKSDPKLSKN